MQYNTMEVYHKRERWVGVLFMMPLLWFALKMFGIFDHENPRGSDVIAGIFAIGIGVLVLLQSFLGSTRFYFDNEYQRGVLIRKYFYGAKEEYFPYSDISAIVLRCYRRGKQGSLLYKIGMLTKKDLGGTGEYMFYPLRSFSEKESGQFNAQKLAIEISSHTKIDFKDESGTVRVEVPPARRGSLH